MQEDKLMRLLAAIVLLPNAPFIFILSMYIWVKINKCTNPIDMELNKGQSYITPKIQKYIDEIYTKPFAVMVAICVYTFIVAASL